MLHGQKERSAAVIVCGFNFPLQASMNISSRAGNTGKYLCLIE